MLDNVALEMILAKGDADDVKFTLLACVLTPISAAIGVVMTLSFLYVPWIRWSHVLTQSF